MKQALNTLMHWVRVVDGWMAFPFTKIKSPKWKAAAMAGALVSIIWIVVALVVPLAPFGPNSLCTNDGYAQYMPFLSEFWSIFKENGSVLYSFHGALGSNFYLTIAYYLFSPFTFLVLLFNKSQIPAAANLIIILKNILVVVIMAWYLGSKDRRTRSFLNAACAICYGFGFYFLGYAVNFMWMDSIAMVPLMLYGLERIGTRRGRVVYLLAFMWGILTNFYMGAIISIFLALYYVVMEMEFNRRGLRRFIWFVLCSLCAVLIASFILVPVIQGMLLDNTSRMNPPEFEIFNDLKYFFSRLLPDAEVVRITHNRGTINLYMGTAVVFGSLLFISNTELPLRERIGLPFLCGLYLISTQVSTLNYIFHGFYLQRQVPNRYGFLIALLATIMLQQGFMHLQKNQYWKMGILGFLSALYFIVVPIWTDFDHMWIGFLLAAVCLLYLLAALAHRRKILSWIIILESTAGLVMMAPGSLDGSFTQMAKYIEAANMIPTYRSEIICSEIVNAPLLYGLNGMSAFNSVINPDTASLLGKIGFASGENYYRFFGHTPISSLFLGVRNIIADTTQTLPEPFVQSAQYEDLVIWSAPYETPLGICVQNKEALFNNVNKFENLNNLYAGAFEILPLSATMSGDSDFEFTETDQFVLHNIKAGDQNTFRLDPFEARYVYLYGNAGGTRNFTLTKNGETLEENKYEGNIVYLGTVFYSDVIEITFEAEDDRTDQTVYLQAASLNPENTAAAAQYFQEHGLKNQVITNNTHIQGSYSATEAETMVFTVPYDKGWSASVNGQPVTIQNWNEAFLAIDLPPGENAIELVYEPSGLKLGLILSGIGLVCALILLAGPWAYRRYVKPTSLKKSQSKAESKTQSSTPSKTVASAQVPQAQAIKQRQEAAKQKATSQATNTPPQAEALKKRQATRLKEEASKVAPELTETKTGLARFNPFTRKKKETPIAPTPSKPQAEALVQREKRREEAARAAQAQKEQALKAQTTVAQTSSQESSNEQERHQALVEEAQKIVNQSRQEDALEQVEQSAEQALRFENQEVAKETEATSNSLPTPLEAQEADEKLEQEGLKTFTLQGIVLPEIIQSQDDSSLDVPTLSNGLQSQQDSSSEKASQKTKIDRRLQKNKTNEASSRLVSSDLDLSDTEDAPLHEQALAIAQRLQAGSQKQALDMWEKWIGKNPTVEEASLPTQPFRTNPKEKGSEKTSENPNIEESEQTTLEDTPSFGPYGLKPAINETTSLKGQDNELESQSDLVIEDKTTEQVEEVNRDEFLFSDQEEQQLAEHLAADFLQRLRRQAQGEKGQEEKQETKDSNSKNG